LRLRFGFDGQDPLTLEEVGQRFNLTRERIRQLEFKALRKLKFKAGVGRNTEFASFSDLSIFLD